ncbi:AAA family ATPase [Methanobrevibacter sp. 87.7]|uniref:AAA family ATPase n=1 Tax=Methanobrevibacter sp. 87.7 TaxID=387957 RepID=UPI000B4FDC9E|nr:AAA family ATPase [Methanobrevibacter sp. 87.7]OWT32474.1 AAA family ATPase [Methanobrevibacter sp. 87.7]
MKSNNKNQEIKIKNSKTKFNPTIDEISAKKLKLKPVGYPFKFSLMENIPLEISNEKLFEDYAKEQWLGIELKKESYLFDQKMIPDYAFKILEVEPNNSILTTETKITVDTALNTVSEKIEPKNFNIKFKDIVGQENAKNKVRIIERYVKSPEKFGQWAPQNILFYGLPGTGKTMLVKALANNLNVPLYLVKATSLIGDHVGDGARQIHELYENANKNAPSIIFIDEIDAIALHRQFQSLRGDVSEIVNSLLTELDGINPNTGVVTIGATNNINFLDLAVRSRFEEEIEFKLPTDKERKEILENNIKTLPLNVNINIDKIVKLTKGMSGRDLKQKILKTSLHHALCEEKDEIDMDDIHYALEQSKKKVKNEVKNMYE